MSLITGPRGCSITWRASLSFFILFPTFFEGGIDFKRGKSISIRFLLFEADELSITLDEVAIAHFI